MALSQKADFILNYKWQIFLYYFRLYPDVSHTKEIVMCKFSYVDEVCMSERFLTYKTVTDYSGEGLTGQTIR